MLKFGSKNDINAVYKCTVRLLDDSEVLECEFQLHHKGTYLLEYVCKQLNLIEKDYFGLRYVDNTRQRHWVDLGKALIKQVKDMDPVLFSFRVKFYPPDPFILKEEITRYQVYLQLKRDLLHGRLYCSQSDAALLGAYIVQAQLGDYDPEIHEGNYISQMKLLLKQTPSVEEKILELHQTQLKGRSPSTSETYFLKKASQLDTYGVDPHPVKDHRGNTLYLGINHLGILTFQGSKKTRHFNWSEVQKINYEGKMFIIHLVYYEVFCQCLILLIHFFLLPRIPEPRDWSKNIVKAPLGKSPGGGCKAIKNEIQAKKHTVGFKCPTAAACRYVWRCAVEQMLFFTLQKSADAPVMTGGGLFSWGTKFRYSGRTEKEILLDSRPVRSEEPLINRTGSLRRKASSVPATPSTPIGSDLGYSSLRRSNHSVPDSRQNADYTLFLSDPENPLSFLETVSEDQEHGVGKPRLPDVDVEKSIEGDANEKSDKLSVPVENGSGVFIGEGIKDMVGADDYHFRDSFDRSSCDSQIQETVIKTTLPSHRSSRSHSPQVGYRVRMEGSISSLLTSGITQTPVRPSRTGNKEKEANVGGSVTTNRFSLFQVFIPSFLFVAISLIAGAVLILESDSDILSNFRGLPEMITLKKQYYEPIKEFLTKRLFTFLYK